MLEIIYNHAIANDVHFYTGVLNKPLYQLLISKNFSISQVGDEITLGKTKVIPFLFDVKEGKNNLQKIKWFSRYLLLKKLVKT
ncbi:hypothetical protein GLW08_06860 [Pontibacillus yanchengensis]|uniref:Uncharacterized protein n=1 Tax=Pontibacillus yanchengensis TaxID=462910 RepID=A0ACC7VE38_9BACI|nr:hypothetical protein [Pontibacillus yanchengensis]MYL53057.1 hypothetical protein [Pontibacillus yanchengensis]